MAFSRYEITVRGIVQGVGFRPFVYRLATSLGLTGTVRNAGSHLHIDIEGDQHNLTVFLERLRAEHPPLARITEFSVTPLPYQGFGTFTIDESVPLAAGGDTVYLSPDLALCADCRRELLDPSDRRYGYPFINCTNCGPRLSIITGVPYDRAKTTMQAFPLCPDCAREYNDPTNRRYHAEPIACPVCGPQVSLIAADGSTGIAHGLTAVTATCAALAAGQIIAIKGLGGFHLAGNALDGDAVQQLRRRKARDEKPFAVMAANLEVVARYCDVDQTARTLLQSPASPIVLLSRRTNQDLPDDIAPGNPSLGVMLPYTPIHELLFANGLLALLVMTSGNISGEPICYQHEDALGRLRGIADAFLLHNREIYTRVDDSVTSVVLGQETVIRRSRGYVPTPVTVISKAQATILACGGQVKNTFCLNRGNEFYLSHHIGDLENFETLAAFEGGITLFKQLLGLSPVAVTHDLHPNYLSTQYAQAQPLPQVAVQHHRAHIAACLADNQLEGAVIGVAFDGTGYGDDGRVWGGEFFVGDLSTLERIGHLEYVSIPGGDSAMAAPWKTACGYLIHAYGGEVDIPSILPEIPTQKSKLVTEMLAKGINVYATSSAGRLFDAAAALCGIRTLATYEGQAAIELEYASTRATACGESYPFTVANHGTTFTIQTASLIRELVEEKLQGQKTPVIAMRFHESVASIILEGCLRAREVSGLHRVVLSGGVFQNSVLVRRTLELLTSTGFTVFRHRQVPTNDGGLALGQALLALASLAE